MGMPSLSCRTSHPRSPSSHTSAGRTSAGRASAGRTSAGRTSAGRAFALALGFACASLASAAAPSVSPLDREHVWITVGADAFEMLQHADELRVDGNPLELHRELGEVVATRVRTADLDTVSGLIHRYFQRCSGFMVHADRADAEAALVEAAPVARGASIEYLLDQQAFVTIHQNLIQEANILSTIESLSTSFNNRYYAHDSGRAAAVWIRDLWQGYATGRDDVTVELVEHSWNQPSVVLTIEGTFYPDQFVVLGGHLDSIAPGSSSPSFSAPGADDNASGIASLSEALRVLLESGFRPSRTVQFMGYAAEEIGLLGSAEIAAQYEAEGADVVGVLQLDMTAFNGSLEDVALLGDYTNSTLTAFVGELIDTYQPSLSRVGSACGYGCSDHASWHREGYPTAMAFEARVGQHNGSIHSTGDTLDTLDNSAAHSAKFARIALAFAAEVGKDNLGELFLDGFENGDTGSWTELVRP